MPANGHEHEPAGVVGTTLRLGRSIVAALPPAFLLLCVINAALIAMVLWFIDDQLDQRTKLVGILVERCMDIALRAPK
jgi:hypothetical protein